MDKFDSPYATVVIVLAVIEKIETAIPKIIVIRGEAFQKSSLETKSCQVNIIVKTPAIMVNTEKKIIAPLLDLFFCTFFVKTMFLKMPIKSKIMPVNALKNRYCKTNISEPNVLHAIIFLCVLN